jgi:hypothetical protein
MDSTRGRVRHGSGRLSGDWDAKKPEPLKHKKQRHRRPRARRLVFIALGVGVLAVGGAILVFVR